MVWAILHELKKSQEIRALSMCIEKNIKKNSINGQTQFQINITIHLVNNISYHFIIQLDN